MGEPPKPSSGAGEPLPAPEFRPLPHQRAAKEKEKPALPEIPLASDEAHAPPEFRLLPHQRSAKEKPAPKKQRPRLEAKFLFHDSDAGAVLGRALSSNTDPQRLPLSQSMRRLGPRLLDGLAASPGLFLVIGEAGLGKSTFLARIAAELRATARPVIVPPAPGFAADPLLQALSSELRIAVPIAKKAAWLRALHHALDRGESLAPILLVDDADLLREEALLVLVAPLEATERDQAGIRLVLCGRPGLRDRIERPALAGLRKHLRFEGELEPYGEADLLPLLVGQRAIGDPPPAMPSREVVARMVEYSGGRPAAARFLWERALALAVEEGERVPRLPHLDQAAHLLRPRETSEVAGAGDVSGPDPSLLPAAQSWRGSGRNIAAGAAAAVMLVALWIAAVPLPLHLGSGPDRLAESAPTVRPSEAPATTPPRAMTAALEPLKPPAPTNKVAIPPAPIVARHTARPAPPPPAARVPEPAPTPSPQRMQTAALEPIPRPPEKPAAPAIVDAPAPHRPAPHEAQRDRKPAQRHETTAAATRPKKPEAPVAMARREATPPMPEREPPHPAVAAAEDKPSQPSGARSSCQPYVSFVNFAGHVANVRGVACRDRAGQWWVMNQQQEATP